MQLSGLVTGLDTSSLVKQLMSVERLPGDRMVKAKTSANVLSGALTRLNGLVKTMAEAAKAAGSSGIPNTWTSQSATSSNTAVATVSASTSAPSATTAFTVASVAAAGGAVTGEVKVADAATSIASADFALNLRKGTDVLKNPGDPGSDTVDTTLTVTAGTTLDGLAKQINDDASLGLAASVTRVSDGTYRLQVVSKDTGANTNVTLTGDGTAGAGALFEQAPVMLTRAADTVLHFGDVGAGYDVRSRTKTVTGVLEGATITAVKADASPVSVDVKRDVDAMAGKVEAMVKAANEALSNIRINSKADLAGKGASKSDGAFVGSSTTRDLTNQIANVFVGSANAVPSLAGVTLDKDGTVTFDKAKFTQAYADDPDKVTQTLSTTADKLQAVGKAASNSSDGMVTVAIRGADALQKDYTDQIKRFDDRMTRREEMLMRQYSALDSMLSKLKSQSDWLAGQLKSLPTIQNNSN